jgi:hypothetical protein
MKQSDQQEHLSTEILTAVDNQLRDNNPAVTRDTLDRLKKEGRSDADAKRLIGAVLAAEMYEVLKSRQPFSLDRYVRNLNRLPVLPWEG